MDALDIARWQFGITTVYHFIFVPLTIGLSPLVALMQTFWVRTGDEKWLRLTKFFGKLLLINFAIGVATGIVQEFQFGMNWSEYSRFVGDVFGAPLAMEALSAFPHTISAAFLTAGTFIAGISAWWMVRSVRRDDEPTARVHRSAVVLGVVTVLVSGMAIAGTGDQQAKLMYKQQPMKMSSAEALCDGETGASLSLLTIGDVSNSCDGDLTTIVSIPGVTSFLASGSFDSYLPGVTELQARSEDLYGAGVDYRPNLVMTYWSFRLMIGLGLGSAALAAAALWLLRRRRVVANRWFAILGVLVIPLPFL